MASKVKEFIPAIYVLITLIGLIKAVLIFIFYSMFMGICCFVEAVRVIYEFL